MINLLILSAGTRNKIVQYFKKEISDTGKGKVIGADCSALAPALYDADEYVLIPRIDAPDYLAEVLHICREKQVTAVFSLIDPELSLIAKHRAQFEALGVTVVVSSYELCELCLDKYQMFLRLRGNLAAADQPLAHHAAPAKPTVSGLPVAGNFLTPMCYLTPEAFFAAKAAGEIDYPVFVKPVRGSASIDISRVQSDEEIRVLFARYDNLMIQEFMHGQEYGADAYVDLITGKCTAVFLKKKLKMRAGETDKSVSVKDEALLQRIATFAESMGFRGMIDLDLFSEGEETDGGVKTGEGSDPEAGEIAWADAGKIWYLSEVNPRFGGGYPHAYACGVNFPAMLVQNLEGQPSQDSIGAYDEGVYMMKYNEIAIHRGMQ